MNSCIKCYRILLLAPSQSCLLLFSINNPRACIYEIWHRNFKRLVTFPSCGQRGVSVMSVCVFTLHSALVIVNECCAFLVCHNIFLTKRMHSSRMRTVRCSGRPGGMSAQGCVSAGGVVCLPVGVCPGGCLPASNPPPVDRMTDTCENITLPQLHCGR